MFCGGNCAFAGDYLHLSPRVPYVQTANGWRLTTANAVDKNKLPAPVVQGLWSDTRDVLLPTTGPLADWTASRRVVHRRAAVGLLSTAGNGPGLVRQPRVARWEHLHGPVHARAALCRGAGDLPRVGHPAGVSGVRRESRGPATILQVDDRCRGQRLVRLCVIRYDESQHGVLDHEADVAIGPYSSVTGSVVLGPCVNQSVLVTVEEIGVDPNGLPVAIPNAAKTTVTLYTAGQAASTGTETRTPVVSPTPEITFPFAGRLPITVSPATPFTQNPFVQNPFSQNPFSQNPFSQNPFSQNPFSQNPFSQNPFSQNPFAQHATIYEVTDISFRVTNEGSFDAAFIALLNVQNALQLTGSYFFQVLINRASPASAMYFDQQGNCVAFDGAQPIQVSSIVTPFSQNPFSQNPFSQNPFSQNPFSQNPFSQNPFSQNPFSQNPFSQNPFSQNTDPRDPAVSNSSFYIAPQTSELPPTPEFRARRPPDEIIYTLRAYQIRANDDPDVSALDSAGRDPATRGCRRRCGHAGRDRAAGRRDGLRSGRGACVEWRQRSSRPAGVRAATDVDRPRRASSRRRSRSRFRTGRGCCCPGPPSSSTLAIGANPGGGTLAGTTTRDDDDDGSVDGIVTFPGLSINNAGIGYTLVASSVGLTGATSTPFDISRRRRLRRRAERSRELVAGQWQCQRHPRRQQRNVAGRRELRIRQGRTGVQPERRESVRRYRRQRNAESSERVHDRRVVLHRSERGRKCRLSVDARLEVDRRLRRRRLVPDLRRRPAGIHAVRQGVAIRGLRRRRVPAAVANANNVITTAAWYHVAGTFDASASPQANLYVNGALVASSTTSIAAISPNAVTMRIGAMHQDEVVGTTTYGSDRLNGLADEVHFFDRALTLANVQAIYNANGAALCNVETQFVVINTGRQRRGIAARRR